MRTLSEDRFLADLAAKDPVQHAYQERLIKAINKIARDAGIAIEGDTPAPPPVNAITVKSSGEMIHATLSHGAEVSRQIEYFIEADNNPSFTQPHLVSHGPSRSHVFQLPSLTDAGAQQKWFLRAFAQYPGSKPSNPAVLGGFNNPTSITPIGTTRLSLLPSTGSGTSSTTGQQGGQGRGRYRVSTPKVVRVGRSVQSNTPVVAPVIKPAVHLLAAVSSASQQTTITQSGTSTLLLVNQNPGDGTFFLGSLTVIAQKGQVDPGAYGTFYVYHDDPGLQGGVVKYVATTNINDLGKADGRFFDGAIVTTSAGGGTGGSTSGGVGGSTANLVPPVEVFKLKNLSGNVSLTGGVAAVVDSTTVTMPSSGGPWRAFISYQYFAQQGTGTNAGESFANDGAVDCAQCLAIVSGGSSAPYIAADFFPALYANNAAITFSVTIKNPGNQTILASSPLLTLASHLTIAIMASK